MRPGVKFGDVPMEDTLLKVLLDPDLDSVSQVRARAHGGHIAQGTFRSGSGSVRICCEFYK
jgi:hypothetical protein